jgi:hypothetical protein
MNIAGLLAALLLVASPAAADVLHVGANSRYKAPSQALQAATDGDTVEIEPGEYFDCSRVNADRLTIVGLDEGATFSDTTCDGKAQLIVRSTDVTIRNITFTRARVNDGNGAGIRAEGRDLTLDRVRFINNQSALLAASSPHSIITIKNSQFEENGACTEDGRCVSTVQIGDIARLRIEKSKLTAARGGNLITSNARRTELYGNSLTDGPKGHSSGLIQVAIGSLVMEDNTLQKGTPYTNRAAAIFVLPSDAPLGEITVHRTIYTDNTGSGSALAIDYSGARATFSDNVVPVGSMEFSQEGITRYRAGLAYRSTKAALLDTARFLKQGVKVLLGR